ncbi:heavy metal-associated isoprenylated plant protein 2 isoform X2 [Salvia divinorum]|uniref:Heavy metal-associated isoprenylated plant protein 2 isoform X2 n=1 Tax=Salvia divinorum TaxID=28513 RepID=A0ABD1HS74_SALDI
MELSVSISNQKCRSGILKAVAKLTGVDELKVDPEKGKLTVVGNVDPISVATTIRKAGYSAEITSVGPHKKPDQKPAGDEQKKPSTPTPMPDPSPAQCQLVAVTYTTYDSAFCSIL